MASTTKKSNAKSKPAVALSEEDRTAGLTKAAEALGARGMTVSESSTEWVTVNLGLEGLVKLEGAEPVFPATLTVAGGAKAETAWKAAVARASVERLIEKLGESWTESGSDGSTRYFFSIPAIQPEMATAVWSFLAAHQAIGANGKIVASLDDGVVAIAPSRALGVEWTRIAGKAGMPTALTASELTGLAAAVDEASVEPNPARPHAYDLRKHSVRTNAARDFFNRTADDSRILGLLDKAGWTYQSESMEAAGIAGSYAATPPGREWPVAIFGDALAPASLHVGSGMEEHSVEGEWTYSPADTGGLTPRQLHRAFDLVAFYEYDGDVDVCAEALLASGEARIEVRMFAAQTIVQIDAELETNALVGAIVNAVARGVSAADPALPMAVAHYSAEGSLRGIVSSTPQGGLRRWSLDSVESLIYSAAQLVTYTGEMDKETGRRKSRPHHTILKNVCRMVWEALTARGTLPEVDIVASEAVITSRGVIVAEHGYNARARTLLSIPERERAAWAAMKVPAKPTLEQAQASFEWIQREVAHDFPFDTPGDRARYMAYLLTCAGRQIIDTSPAFGSDGAEYASGKTKMLALGRYISNGHAGYATWTGGRLNEKEDINSLVSGLLAANGGVVFDTNDEASASSTTSTGKLESLMLTSAITAPDGQRTERVLGANNTVAVADVIFTAAGNGIVWGADLVRRHLTWRIILKTGEKAVERGGFRHADLESWVRDNRVEILGHLFTILAHGIQNPAAVPGYGLGAFSKVILGSMDHLTIGGANAHQLAMDKFAANLATDDISEDWGQTMSALSRLAGGRSFEAKHARIWASTESIETPAKIRNSKATREVALSKVWAVQLGIMLDRNVSFGQYRYKLKLTDSTPGAAKSFHIERWEHVGTETKRVPEPVVTGDLPVEAPEEEHVGSFLSMMAPPEEIG